MSKNTPVKYHNMSNITIIKHCDIWHVVIFDRYTCQITHRAKITNCQISHLTKSQTVKYHKQKLKITFKFLITGIFRFSQFILTVFLSFLTRERDRTMTVQWPYRDRFRLFVPKRNCVPTRTFLGVPNTCWHKNKCFSHVKV